MRPFLLLLPLLFFPNRDGYGAVGPQFEVASLKPNSSPGSRIWLAPPVGDTFSATNVTPRMLISLAWGEFRISGGPAWLNSDRYDLTAKAPDAVPNQERFLAMLRNLLEDRFQLKSHREQREQTEYALTVAKSGPKLPAPKEAACPAESAPAPIPCGRLSWGGGRLYGRRSPMSMLVFVLSQALAHKVIDETGLAGPYDMDLRWTPESALNQAAPDAPPPLLTAVQEQMGLKLQPRKGTTEAILVDHVERPSVN